MQKMKYCKKLLLVGMIIIFLASPTYAVITFEKWYGGTDDDEGHSVIQTADGGYIIAGETKSFGTGMDDVYLIKTDSLGDSLWTKTYGGIYYDYGFSVVQTPDAGYIIVGYTRSFGAGSDDVYLIKTDSLGGTVWTKTYGGTEIDHGYSVAQTTDGGYIITGCTCSFGSGLEDVYLIKTNSLGDTLWTKTYGGTNRDNGWSVVQTSDGGYTVTGYTYSFGAGSADVYLIKTDFLGESIWIKTYGGTLDECGSSVEQTSDGGFIIAGETWSFGTGKDIYLIKTDSLGDSIWTRTYGGSDWDVSYSVAQTSDGGYIITGYTCSFGSGLDDVYLIKTDALGDTVWTRTYGKTDGDYGKSVQQTSDGGYIITGSTGWDLFLIKATGEGDTLWTKIYGKRDWDSGSFVQETKDKGYIITGATWGYGGFNIYLIKTDSLGDTLWTGSYGGEDYEWGHCVQETNDGGFIIVGERRLFDKHGSSDIYLIKLKPEK